MKIILNGKIQECAESTRLKNVIEQFCKDTRRVIAEVNGAIVKNTAWAEKNLADGDVIELVNFVGGG
ncbi:MAG TPA: sulfur carrier protein ThiS [Candidatus Omnitrophota bacterium]|nr:sulfur carrier protein ThiS [Candidatus Omnitrophota bacterium]